MLFRLLEASSTLQDVMEIAGNLETLFSYNVGWYRALKDGG